MPARRSPSGPAEAGAAASRSHGIAVASTTTPSTRRPTTLLPSFACHVWTGEMLRDQLPVVAEEIGARREQRPAVPGRSRVTGVDLDADCVADEEHLVALADGEPVRDVGRRRGPGVRADRPRRDGGDGCDEQQTGEAGGGACHLGSPSRGGSAARCPRARLGGSDRAFVEASVRFHGSWTPTADFSSAAGPRPSSRRITRLGRGTTREAVPTAARRRPLRGSRPQHVAATAVRQRGRMRDLRGDELRVAADAGDLVRGPP